MAKNILFRSFTSECEEVVSFLNEKQISYVEVFSERDNDPPVFMPSIQNHEYRGYEKIINFLTASVVTQESLHTTLGFVQVGQKE